MDPYPSHGTSDAGVPVPSFRPGPALRDAGAGSGFFRHLAIATLLAALLLLVPSCGQAGAASAPTALPPVAATPALTFDPAPTFTIAPTLRPEESCHATALPNGKHIMTGDCGSTWDAQPDPSADQIVTKCKPEPAPATATQQYAILELGEPEYCWLYWIVQHESNWRPTLWQDSDNDGACGLPQANPCSKMSECAGYSVGWAPPCVPHPDWQIDADGQISWMIWWVYVAMRPDYKHRAFTEGGSYYGSMAEAACHEFGCRTKDGVYHAGEGWY